MSRLTGPPFWVTLLLACGGALGLLSCASKPSSEPAVGIAYVGPPKLSLRKDLAPRSGPVGSAGHGDHLDILEIRRRFVRVRTDQGIEGWVDGSQLLTPAQMDSLRQLSKAAKDLPSQGVATVFDALNVHTEPGRLAPSFYQIQENEKVEVVGHTYRPRQQQVAAAITVSAGKRSGAPKKDAKPAKPPIVPLPPGPPLPANWVALSRPRKADVTAAAAAASGAAPIPLDDWNLVRMKDGKAGWVLSRMLFMAIPDEVAQYAERHRIAAYLPLGEVKDGGQTKQNWLWATADTNLRTGDFDGFRVFTWSSKRHHYETAFVERNVAGFHPLEVVNIPGDTEKGFSVVVQEKDGQMTRRIYRFAGFRVKLLRKEPYEPPKGGYTGQQEFVPSSAGQPEQAEPSRWQHWWDQLSALPKRWLRRDSAERE